MRQLSKHVERTVTDMRAIGKAVLPARSMSMAVGILVVVLGNWSASATATDIKVTQVPDFQSAGLRRGYYHDNKEDALIMWRTVAGDREAADEAAATA